MELISRARQGFAAIDADGGLKDRALRHLHQWLTGAEFAAYRPQLEWLIGEHKWPGLLDSFYQVLPFGTGGRRGAVGVGPNRMNPWTLGASVQGHCDYLRQKFPGAEPLRVVIAYDVRKFLDQRKVYNPDLPNPVLGLSSRDLARYAAGVYAANGILVHMPPDESERFLATPELSFFIRSLGAHGGLNISASHNPPDDNGGKFYDERGGQPVPPDDQIMSDLVEQVKGIKYLAWADVIAANKLLPLGDELHAAYIEICKKQSLIPPPRFDEFAVVFTPLHGVGATTAMEVLAGQGFRPIPVEEQMAPDGQFPNVTKSPNPEVPESMDRAEQLARQRQADLVLATDPDADRLGGLAADGRGGYRFLTGNEIAALVTDFKLSQLHRRGEMPPSPIVVKSLVTSSLVTRIARSHGCQVVDDVLVGFKYVADVLWHLETTGQYGDVRGTPADFILGCEESHGLLMMPQIRDKDAGGGALVLAELALDAKRRGRTVPQLLDEIASRLGYFRNEVINITMTGIEGKTLMERMLDQLRSNPPHQIGGLAVTRFEDLRDENGRMGPWKGETDRAGRNVLVWELGDAARVTLRPSGTEPKAKAYIEVCTQARPSGMSDGEWADERHLADERVRRLADEFHAAALATVGLKPGGPVKLSR